LGHRDILPEAAPTIRALHTGPGTL
jgi:hypothetical protein